MPLDSLELRVAAHRRRRALELVVRAVAIVASVALVATLALVWVGNRFEYTPTAALWLGAVLYLAILLAFAGCGIWPLARLGRGRMVGLLEDRIPELGGRLQTWFEQSLENRASRLFPMLEADARERLDRHPPAHLFRWHALVPGVVAGIVAAAGLAWLAFPESGAVGEGARRVWAFGIGYPGPAWEVAPGHAVVSRGTDWVVRARPTGFRPGEATIHVRTGPDAPEDRASMRVGDSGFEFRFAAVDHPFTYRVSAGGVSSGSYRVSVREPPRLTAARTRYVYPEWAHLEVEEVDRAEDIRVLPGTRVELEVVIEPELGSGVLVVQGEPRDLRVEGDAAIGQLRVEGDGHYYLAARVGERLERLTRDYSIRVLPDEAPQVEIDRPGRDRRATSIEEVTARVRASDDVHVEAVELHYSVNGGPWSRERLRAGRRDVEVEHLLALEELRGSAGGQGSPPGLAPGDVIAYYASARDHSRSARTELYFVEVVPFDMRYVQSQQAPGQGLGAGADLSRRQRQLVIATWNLVRDPQERPEEARNRAELLSGLQETLRAQTQTLIERIRARGMGLGDPTLSHFVEQLDAAVDDMERAVAHLGAFAVEDALEPEQRALQRLLRAESSFRERQISLQASADPGGGTGAQDLEELIELEMDPRKNVYELADRAAAEGPRDAEADRSFEELERLARRQQRLAQEMSRVDRPGLTQRYEQETLAREARDLRRRLDARPGEGSGALARRLEAATRSMQEALRDWSDSAGGVRKRLEQAQQSLDTALREARGAQRERDEQAVADLARGASELVEAQRDASSELARSVAPVLQAEGGGFFDREPSEPERDQVRARAALRARLVQLGLDAEALADAFDSQGPEVAETLRRAVSDLEQSQVREQMAFAEELVQRGGSGFVLGVDQDALGSLEAFRDRTAEARRRAEALRPRQQPAPDASLAGEVRALRRRLEAASRAANASAAQAELPDVAGGAEEGEGDSAWSSPARWSDLDSAATDTLRQTLREVMQDSARLASRSEASRSRAPSLSALGSAPRPGSRPLALRVREALVELERLELDLSPLAESEDDRGPRASDSSQSDRDAPGVAEYYRRLGEETPGGSPVRD